MPDPMMDLLADVHAAALRLVAALAAHTALLPDPGDPGAPAPIGDVLRRESSLILHLADGYVAAAGPFAILGHMLAAELRHTAPLTGHPVQARAYANALSSLAAAATQWHRTAHDASITYAATQEETQ